MGLANGKAKIVSSGLSSSCPLTLAANEALSNTLATIKTALTTSSDFTVQRNAVSTAFQTFQSSMMAADTELKALIALQPAQLAQNALAAASNYATLPKGADGLPPIQTGVVPEGPAQQEPKTPMGCDSDTSKDSCTWLCSNLIDFNSGKVNLKKFGVGGIPNEDAQALPPSTPTSRLLQSGTTTTSTKWNPSTGEAGTSSSFEENPAGVSVNSSSAANLIATAFTAIMMAVAYIMI